MEFIAKNKKKVRKLTCFLLFTEFQWCLAAGLNQCGDIIKCGHC